MPVNYRLLNEFRSSISIIMFICIIIITITNTITVTITITMTITITEAMGDPRYSQWLSGVLGGGGQTTA